MRHAASSGTGARDLGFREVLLLLALLGAARVAGLFGSQVDLYVDEAQYWAWSREIAFGYYSKPPLLAWIIGASERICGSAEACVRASSPVLYAVTCAVTYAVARQLYDRRVAVWSALIFALAAGMSFSARIASTDVPLITCWVVALWAYVRLLPGPDWRWTVVLGVSLGLGLLAKYAMLYFLLCAGAAALIDRDARALLMRPQTLLAALIAAALLAPNLYWNASHGFVTFSHTGENIGGDAALRLMPLKALEFLGAQFALAGPLVFAAFLLVLTRLGGQAVGRADRLMLAFAVPPLALVTALALVRSAHANWAAPSIVALTIVAVAWWLRRGEWLWIRLSIVVGLLVQAALLAGDVHAYRITVPGLGHNADLYHRTLGWRGLGDEAAALASATHARTVAGEERAEVASLIYYLRDQPVTVASWRSSSVAEDHFDLSRPLTAAAATPVLFITTCPDAARLRRSWSRVTPLGRFAVATGPTSNRSYLAFLLREPQPEVLPLGSCG